MEGKCQEVLDYILLKATTRRLTMSTMISLFMGGATINIKQKRNRAMHNN